MTPAPRLLLAAALVLTVAPARAEPLRVGLLPTETALEVIRQHEPFRAALEGGLGRPVEIKVGVDYAATMEALRFGRVDMALLGPAAYVLVRSRAAVEPFARASRGGNDSFTASIIVRAGSGIENLAALSGRVVALGDVASTSGNVVPRHMLLAAGLAGRDAFRAHHLAGHDAVALAVLAGHAAAGGVSTEVLGRLVARGTVPANALATIAESAPVPEYPWTFRAGLPPADKTALRRIVLELLEPAALHPFRADRFVAAADEDYAPMRRMMIELGLVRD